MNQPNDLHLTPEEKLARSSQSAVSAIQENTQAVTEVKRAVEDLNRSQKNDDSNLVGFTETVRALKQNNDKLGEVMDSIDTSAAPVVRKLDEIKSAALQTNRSLKTIADKEAPKTIEVTMPGISVLTLKGDKGDKGLPGKDGKNGLDGNSGANGKDGKDGKDGKNGVNGKDGQRGADGKDGREGRDGSPDAPDDVVVKINDATTLINPKQIRGLLSALQFVDDYGKNPHGAASSGANPLIFQDEGTRIGDYVTTLNVVGSAATLAYSGNGVATLTISSGSGGSTGSWVDVDGVVDGNNVTFTLHGSPVLVGDIMLQLARQPQYPTLDYTRSGNTITYLTAPISDLSTEPHKAFIFT